MSRLLIVDENLDKRIATYLTKRGRPSQSHQELGMTGMLDGDVLSQLASLKCDWIFITGDDRMPFEHSEVIERFGATIATIDGEWEKCCTANGLNLTQQEFNHETVHRWAHVMAEQTEGQVRRYSPLKNSVWTPRRKYFAIG